MILQADKNLEDYLVELLVERPKSGVFEMREVLSKMGKKYTVQAIYKGLRKLQSGGIVVKVGRDYSLRIPWVIGLKNVSDQAYKNYFESPSITSLLPEIGKKEIWHFNNLLKLNDFWSQILLLLVQQSKNKILLGYNPHTWFHLVQTEQEDQYLKSVGFAGGKLYLVIGGKTYLDKWAQIYFDRNVVKFSFAKSSFEESGSDYVNVIDDYVVTVKIDHKTSDVIDKLYSETLSIEEINIGEILRIFNGDVKASIWVEKNPEKAKKIKRKFKDFFGVDF